MPGIAQSSEAHDAALLLGVGAAPSAPTLALFVAIVSVVFLLTRRFGRGITNPERSRAIAEDLTNRNEELQAANRTARDAEARLRQLVKSVHVILFRVDRESHRPTFIGGEAEGILGYSSDRWLSEPSFIRDHCHQDDRDRMIDAFRAGAAADRDFAFEGRMIRADGRVVWLRTLVHAADPSADGRELIGVMIDITAEKNAAEFDSVLRALLEKAAVEWERTFNAIRAMVVLVDSDDRVARANRAAQVSAGPIDFPAPLVSLATREPWRTIATLAARARTVQGVVEAEARDVEGDREWAVSASPDLASSLHHEGHSVVVIARDISAERRNESQRAFLTELWSDLAHTDSVNEAAAVILKRLCSFTGWEMGQVYLLAPNRNRLECLEVWYESTPGFEEFHEESRHQKFERGKGVVGGVWASGEPFLTQNFGDDARYDRAVVARKLGLRCMLGLPVHAHGQVVAVVELLCREPPAHEPEISLKRAAVAQFGSLIERYRAQAALAEHERSHALLLSNLSGMAYRCRNDEAWTMTYASEGCLELTGHSANALKVGKPTFGELILAADREQVWSLRQESLAARRPCSNEYRILTATGVEKWVWDQAQGVYDSDGVLLSIEGFITDVSAKKRAEAESRRVNTMVAMGELVAGVAHEVRNPLFAISATIDAFEARFLADQNYAQMIATLRGELDRLVGLMNGLLDYGRPTTNERLPNALAPIVAQAVRGCAAQAARARIRVSNRVPSDLPLIHCDRLQLVQVFQNLIENSLQHTPEEGFVTVDGRLETHEGSPVVICEVADTGTGIPEGDLTRVFEPFVTRRRGGTGLGLAIVQRIIHEHGGAIHARNRASRGTEMELRFPVQAAGGGS